MAEATESTELAPDRAAELVDSRAARVIDVRQQREHEAAHIPGDELITFDQLKERAPEFGEGPVVLYCRSGDRSNAAAQALRASGYDAYSIDGGILAWSEQGLPIEPADGEIVEPSSLPPA